MVQIKTGVDWDNYRYFLAMARSTSIRAAAITLGVSHSTLIRKLDGLECALETRLFDRVGQRLVLTSAGEEVLVGAKELEESVQGISRVVSGRDSELSGVVRVSMPEFFAHESVLFDLAHFNQKFPKIQLEIELSYARADLGRREADIAVRCTNEQPLDLVGRKVGKLTMAAYATQAYIEGFDPISSTSDAKMVGWGSPQTWKPRHGLDHLSALGYFDSIPLQIELAKQGLGVASLPCLVADRLTELHRLTECLAMADVWVLYHADLRDMSRVRAVRDFFYEQLSSKVV